MDLSDASSEGRMSTDSEHSESSSEDSSNKESGESRGWSDDSLTHSEWSAITADEEFGPETSLVPNNGVGFDMNTESSPWVPTFKETLGKAVNHFLDDSLKFCVSGKMTTPPLISILLPRVQKFISFPLYEHMLDSIIPESGGGMETFVNSFRNCWELNHVDFQIMNTEWDSYLTDVLLPLLQHELSLEVGFRLSLYKLQLYKTGSFITPYPDHVRDHRAFGTVIVQLPSIYEGGKLIVRRNNRSEEMDLSSANTTQNGFCAFYTAFYRDCAHEVLPITKGARACLVYNLVPTAENSSDVLPSAARLEIECRQANLVDLLRNSWPKDHKIIYCLSHKYTQRNLSLEKLKYNDRKIAQFFKDYADACGLDIMIGILKRKKYRYAKAIYKPQSDPCPERSRSPKYLEPSSEEDIKKYIQSHYDRDEIETVSEVESNDPTVTFYNDYKIKYLKSLDKEQPTLISSLSAVFEREVIPENCFDDVQACYEDQVGKEHEDVECSKFYRCAALMVYRPDDLLSILVKGDAKFSKIEELFLKEFEKNKDNLTDESVKQKCLNLSFLLMDRFHSRIYCDDDMRKTSEIFENFLLLDDVELLRRFVRWVEFRPYNISYIHRMCQMYGWATFATDIVMRFESVETDKRISYLWNFIDLENDATRLDADMKNMIELILKEMLTKFEYDLDHPPKIPFTSRSPKPLKKNVREEKTKALLISLWPIANKLGSPQLVKFARKQPIDFIVPVLLSVSRNQEPTSNRLWSTLAFDFKTKMENFLETVTDRPLTWKQNVTLACPCTSCKFVNAFLRRSTQQTLDLFGKGSVRDHVQESLGESENLTFAITMSGVLRIKKLRKTGETELEERQSIESYLSKLTELITKMN